MASLVCGMMSKTVGLTSSIGVALLLSPECKLGGGVHVPNKPEVFDYCLDRLADEGIHFVEATTVAPNDDQLSCEEQAEAAAAACS